MPESQIMAPDLTPVCPFCGETMTLHPSGNFYECPNWFTGRRCAQVADVSGGKTFPRIAPPSGAPHVRPAVLNPEDL